MRKFIRIPDETWCDVGYWLISPKSNNGLDRNFITLNHDERNGYILISENLMNASGLTCLEHHILLNLSPEENEAEHVFMLEVPFLICGPDGPTKEQQEADVPEITISQSAPLDYLDQPKVLEALLSLEKKGHIVISREQA